MSISARRFQRSANSTRFTVSDISYRASASTTPGNAKDFVIMIPASVQAGDGMILCVASNGPTVISDPSGWTATSVGTTTSANLTMRVLTRVAQVGDAGTTITLSFSGVNKAAATITAYKGTYGSSVGDNFIDAVSYAADAASATHTTPSVTTTQAGGWIVSVVADRIGTGTPTSSWTINGNTLRQTVYNTSNGAATLAVADSAGAVPVGPTPQRVFTSDVVSVSGLTWTLALKAGAGSGIDPNPNPEPQMYVGMAYSSDYTEMDNLFGRQGIRRSYSTGMPSTFASSSANIDVGKRASWHSVKPDVVQTASGAMDATITAFVNSIPPNHKCMLTFQHEPENPSKNINPATWRTASQRFYTLVKAVRPDILVGPVIMGWTFNPASGRNPDDWNPGANYCDFFGLDPYQSYNPETGKLTWSLAPDASNVSYMNYLRDHVGGKPPALGEFGASVYRGPDGTGPDNFQYKVDWIRTMVEFYEAHNAVAVCYFNTQVNSDLVLTMLEDDPLTTAYWTSLTASHQNGVIL